MDLYTAEEIAEKQLLTALELYQKGDFLCTITLAGAAEEILGKRLRKLNIEPSFERIKNSIMEVARKFGEKDPSADKVLGDLLNLTRNELKHYSGDEVLEFDLAEDSYEMLERAITNYILLTGTVHEAMFGFWTSINDT
ncbi:hypothetical protein [Thiomicrorhabdus indica]|uniref:hypothetical protein n=1 Tax=Thiomicrorhabdus indica TaxID=2267253 RepID=UPI00102D83D6|nr:hypothetical protein [Thiomicrorhabdus indica]